MYSWVRRGVLGAALALLCSGAVLATAQAEPLQSANYKFDESTLGGGGLIQSSSNSYQSSSAIADTAVGESASTNYQVQAGSKTTPDPSLMLMVNNSGTNFGSFSPTTTATATSTFSVSNYTSYGYAVQILGDTPTNGTHALPAMATTGPPTPGVEQFGINVVANTVPASVGANPDQGDFGAGIAAPNYGTSNQFRYVSGETIATSPKTSGVTTFTITYIINVGSLTPGGQYISHQAIVCTGTY